MIERDAELGKIKVALGGHLAEELVFDDTTGAQNDIKRR